MVDFGNATMRLLYLRQTVLGIVTWAVGAWALGIFNFTSHTPVQVSQLQLAIHGDFGAVG